MTQSVNKSDDADGVCYQDICVYTLESLGDNAWLTGCPLCGEQCWNLIPKLEREQIDKELLSGDDL